MRYTKEKIAAIKSELLITLQKIMFAGESEIEAMYSVYGITAYGTTNEKKHQLIRWLIDYHFPTY